MVQRSVHFQVSNMRNGPQKIEIKDNHAQQTYHFIFLLPLRFLLFSLKLGSVVNCLRLLYELADLLYKKITDCSSHPTRQETIASDSCGVQTIVLSLLQIIGHHPFPRADTDKLRGKPTCMHARSSQCGRISTLTAPPPNDFFGGLHSLGHLSLSPSPALQESNSVWPPFWEFGSCV